MKLSDFILLNEEQKKGTLLHEGVLVGKRNTEGYIVFLFQFQNYYVESYCNRETMSFAEFRAFTCLEPLEPYLATIALDNLLN